MRRFQGNVWGEKYVADGKRMIVHDLDNERSLCNVDDVFFACKEFPMDTIVDAIKKGFKTCPYCVGQVSQDMVQGSYRAVWKF